MRPPRLSFCSVSIARLAFVSWVGLLPSLAGCDGSGAVDGGSCVSTRDCASGLVCTDGRCTAPHSTDGGTGGRDGSRPDAGTPPCTGDSDCGGGVCVAGSCCESADRVCGTSCCSAAEICFANACVVPGAECRSAEDCEEGQYCEPALAAGEPTDPVEGCLAAAPPPGRCLELPPECAGAPAPGEVCIRECEYRPEAGLLDAVVQWRWDASTVEEHPGHLDVWATPAVGRITDTNCDGTVDEFDPPNIVFVSGDARGTCCSCGSGNELTCKTGVLRVLDGQSGREVWSLRRASDSSMGFSGLSVAIGDVDHDGDMEIAAVTGEGYVALIDHEGNTVAVSDAPIPGWLDNSGNGWGGGLSIADMDHDGNPEIAYGRVVFTTDGRSVTRLWEGTGSWGRGKGQAISVFVNLDADPELELLAGRTAYDPDGSIKWENRSLSNGFSAVADLDDDPAPDVVHVANGRIYLLDAETGVQTASSIAAPGSSPGNGGPPTIADFDGDGEPEIGVAFANNYQVVQLSADGSALEQLWASPNHDFSSSVTGSTVFDFEGDGAAEVIYNDECFLWVYDGATGSVRFATQTTSFTATEASLVADVDADGSAEIVMISNGASPSGWRCDTETWRAPAEVGDPDYPRPGWVGSDGASAAYRGITVFGASDNSWVGTRTLWNQHAYSVSNICGDRGDACVPPSTYGDIPRDQVANWTVPFLNNFRQNIQGEGIFDAPDATVTLDVRCTDPVRLVASVRNLGAALLPAGVEVGFYLVESGGTERELGRGNTTTALYPSQVAQVEIDAPSDVAADGNVFRARILVDPAAPAFRECREDNNGSGDVEPRCLL